MSHTLYWEPTERKRESLPDELKFALRQKFEFPIDIELCTYDLGFVDGLICGGVEGAEELKGLIERFGRIRLLELS